jgi:integrase
MPKLTDRFVSSLRVEPPRKDRLVFDTECPGLGVRTTTRGTRSFIVQWTDPATKRKVREPIGIWGNITIEQARTAARARLGDVAKGIDPAAERAKRKAAAIALREEQALTLDALIDDWARLHLSTRRPRYVAEAQRAIRLAFRDYLKRPAARLSRAEVIGVLDGIASADKAVTAGRTMAYGRAAFGWAVKRGKVPANPFSGLPVSSGVTERDRVLTDEEVRRVWDATKRLPYPFGPFYQIAILTLQRREEVAGMRWSEIDEGLTRWQIPSGRMKNGKPHDVHLPDAAREILRSMPRRNGVDLVFTTNGRTPISGYSKGKKALDAAIASDDEDRQAISDWRVHDFRRTGVSKLAALGFDSIVVDMLLAHQPARLRGVAAVYQRFNFWEVRRRALDSWAAHVTRLAAPGNVVPLKVRAV